MFLTFLENWYFLIIMLLLASILMFVWLLFGVRNRANFKPWEAIVCSLICIAFGMGSVISFAKLEGLIVNDTENMSLFGAVFFSPLLFFIIAKVKKLRFADSFDIFSVCLLVSLFFARMNCIFSGCCLGKHVPGLVVRYPTREFELIYYAIVISCFIYFFRRNILIGKLFPILLISYGLCRFLTESFRESNLSTFLHMGHYWSILAFVSGTLVLILLEIKKKRESNVKASF